ncbi:unnamed protein product [Cunninghamella blakesleeana]
MLPESSASARRRREAEDEEIAAKRRRQAEIFHRTLETVVPKSNIQIDELTEQLIATENTTYLSRVTKISYSRHLSRWEGYCSYMLEKTNNNIYNNPYGPECCNIENAVRFTLTMIPTMEPTSDDIPQARQEGVGIKEGFLTDYSHKLCAMATMGLLSVTGKPKLYLTAGDIDFAIRNYLESDITRDPNYTIQLIALLNIILFTGVRLGSIIPSQRHVADNWKYLRWRDVKLYKKDRADYGWNLCAYVTFRHVKRSTFSLNPTSTNFSRYLEAPQEKFMGTLHLPLLLMVLASKREFSVTSFENWYLGKQKYFQIKNECLDYPVFCSSIMEGGYVSTLGNQTWTADNAGNAISKFLKQGNLRGVVNAYSLRRNFTNMASRVMNPELANIVTQHAPTGTTYTHYTPVFDDLNVVKLVLDGELEYTENLDDDIHRNRRLTDYSKRFLTRDEFQEKVVSKMADIMEEIRTFEGRMRAIYNVPSMDEAQNKMSAQEENKYRELQCRRIAIQNRLSRAAQQEKLNNLDKQRMEGVVVNDPEDDDAEDEINGEMEVELLEPIFDEEDELMNVDQDAEEILSQEYEESLSQEDESNSNIGMSTDRVFNIAVHYISMSPQIRGNHHCYLCVEDPTLENPGEGLAVIAGHRALIEHIIAGFRNNTWNSSKSLPRGMHTNSARLARQYPYNTVPNNNVCPVPQCGHKFKTRDGKKVAIRTYNAHLANNHGDYLSESQTYDVIRAEPPSTITSPLTPSSPRSPLPLPSSSSSVPSRTYHIQTRSATKSAKAEQSSSSTVSPSLSKPPSTSS